MEKYLTSIIYGYCKMTCINWVLLVDDVMITSLDGKGAFSERIRVFDKFVVFCIQVIPMTENLQYLSKIR